MGCVAYHSIHTFRLHPKRSPFRAFLPGFVDFAPGWTRNIHQQTLTQREKRVALVKRRDSRTNRKSSLMSTDLWKTPMTNSKFGYPVTKHASFEADINRRMSLEFEIKELRGEASVLAALETIEKKTFPKAYSWAGRVAGYLVCTLNGDFVLITRVAVKAPFRRKGLGLQLVLEAIGHFKGKASNACLHVETSNKAAIALYNRAGFTIRAELKDYYRFGSHAYTMQRSIP